MIFRKKGRKIAIPIQKQQDIRATYPILYLLINRKALVFRVLWVSYAAFAKNGSQQKIYRSIAIQLLTSSEIRLQPTA